jgi:hypothetical protein
MYSVSKKNHQKINEPEAHFTPQEAEMVLPPFLMKSFMEGKEEGKAEGKEEGMLLLLIQFIKISPTLSDQQISDMFNVELLLVATARKKAQ